MGKCIYVRDERASDGSAGKPVTREMKSETWMDPAEAGRVLAEGHFLNTTMGIWFYESDVWDKAKLRDQLLALVDHVTSPDFLPKYEEWGKKQLDPMTPKLRILICSRCEEKTAGAVVGGETRDCPKCDGKDTVVEWHRFKARSDR